jgi:hypothetical protein
MSLRTDKESPMNRSILATLSKYLSLDAINGLPPLQINGNLVDQSSLVAYLTALQNGGVSPYNVNLNYSTVTNVTTGALALTPANCSQGVINAVIVCSGGSANTNTTDTANAIVNTYWPGAAVGAQSFLTVANLNSGTMTLAGGTGVTITGTATTVTLANTFWSVKCTNLANPLLPGSVATNTTTTTAAVAANNTAASPTSIIPVTSATGIVSAGSWLGWVATNGVTYYGLVTTVSSLNITVAGVIPVPIASGAAVSVFNSALTFTRMYSTVTATLAA